MLVGMVVPFDYDTSPDRYRLSMAVTRAHAQGSLYAVVAEVLAELGARLVLDVGCADGVLRAALPPRDDSPELAAYWTRPHTPFDAEDAPELLGQVFDAADGPVVRDAPLAVTEAGRAPHREAQLTSGVSCSSRRIRCCRTVGCRPRPARSRP